MNSKGFVCASVRNGKNRVIISMKLEIYFTMCGQHGLNVKMARLYN